MAAPSSPSDTTSPGLPAIRPTREDAWMYSAVFFGCPTTSMSPSRGTSTPTWSIDVARTTSYGRSGDDGGGFFASIASRYAFAYSAFPRVLQRSAPNGSASRSSVLEISSAEIREVSSPMFKPREVVRPPRERLGVSGDTHRHVVVEVAPHAGQLAGGAEVADGRQVRIRRVAVLVEQLLSGEQEHLGRAGSPPGSAGSRGRRRRRTSARIFIGDRASPSEKKVSRTSSTCGGNTSTPRP